MLTPREREVFDLLIDGMPPKDHNDRPTRKERQPMVEWLELKLYHVDCSKVKDVGRVTIHRLNRVEYNNTIRDLLGVDTNPAKDFPSDDLGHGFSNNANVLSLSPLLLEKYVDAAEEIALVAIPTETSGKNLQRYEGDQLKVTNGVTNRLSGTWLSLNSEGSVYRNQEIQRSGEYIIRIEAMADQAGPEVAKMEIRIDGKKVKVYEVKGYRDSRIYEVRRNLTKGRRRIEAAFINDYYKPKAKEPRDRDRNLAIRFIEIESPTHTPPQANHRIVFTRPSKTKTVKQAATEIFQRLMSHAFRRPATKAEVNRVVKLVELATQKDDSFERGVQVGLQAVLVSPHFLFRIELDAQPNNAKSQHHIGQFELASRLSYFLWSTMPDYELFRLAKQGKLQDPKVLDGQITRMLKDSKADALVENFASQWLNLSNLVEVTPDPKLFPEFTPELRRDMIRETQMFIRSIFRDDRSLLDFLDADFTYVNQRLAKHYGIKGVQGEKMRRVSLPSNQRTGVLTHGSILTLTSNPNRTSLVRRGNWIVNNVLGLQLPEMPVNVPSLEEGAKKSGASSLREQLKLHRKKAACAACHATLDPLGFGFENFDAIGRWREKSEGKPVDSRGTLLSGESFSGPIQLVKILKKRERKFAELVTKKMFTYALGRGLELPDSCAVDSIVAELEDNDYRFTVLVRGIIHSRPFLMRRGDEGAKK
ncbi:MAG: DUF1592 domain-containing protein [Planctomycetes bacterium]|nr:DUF1592 domain-containing protein [Planctomycetota bacterium]